MNRIDLLQRLFGYKAWANGALLTRMEQLDGALPSTEIALRALGHSYVVDRIFAAHMTQEKHGHSSANMTGAASLKELSEGMRASDQWYIDYVAGLDESQLAERIDFTFTDGAPGRMSREEMLMHVIVHGGYHRGQVGWIMTLESVAPPPDGLTSYLHLAEAAGRRRSEPQGQAAAATARGGAELKAAPAQNPPEAPAAVCTEMSRLEALTCRMKAAAAAAGGLGKTLKFDLKGEGFVFIDGGMVSNEDKPADLTLTISIDDLRAIGQGRLSTMAAVMRGRLKASDMGLALGLQGKIKTLFGVTG
jgi:uncharacterized damage-inducible protein DinB/putative sterol carrier protein